MPIARILAIGDELVLGRTVDTNSTALARMLGDLGFTVDQVRQIGDGEAGISAAVRSLANGAAVVVCTGGLGPTADDRTRQAVAVAMGVILQESRPAWLAIRRAWAKLRPGVVVPEANRQQAMVPDGGAFLPNDRGTAPGLLIQLGTCQVACLPGVPHEMLAMAQRLMRRLPKLVPGLIRPLVAEVWFSGMGESSAQERIADLFTEHNPQVGITVNERGHITLRVVGTGAMVRPRARALAARLGAHVLPAAGLAPSLVQELALRKWTMTAAESCTCGHVAAQMGAIPGASTVWQAGFIAYHDAIKKRVLGVPAALLRRHGAVSAQVAAAMATGARKLAQADLAVATSGIAGPGGATADKPVGFVWLACASAHGVVTREVRIGGDRERVQRRAAAAALQLAWDVMHGLVSPSNAAH